MSLGNGTPPGSTYDERTQAVFVAARKGDRVALENLFERVAPALLSWAHLRMSPAFRKKVDPHDVVQEVWVRAMQRFSELDPGTTPFRAWIFRVAHFVVIEMSRRVLRAPGQGGQRGSSLFTTLPSGESGVSTGIARSDAVHAFLERVGRLDSEHRELVVLRGLEGASFEEIAGRLGGRPAAWEKRWQRLRARLALDAAPDYLL